MAVSQPGGPLPLASDTIEARGPLGRMKLRTSNLSCKEPECPLSTHRGTMMVGRRSHQFDMRI